MASTHLKRMNIFEANLEKYIIDLNNCWIWGKWTFSDLLLGGGSFQPTHLKNFVSVKLGQSSPNFGVQSKKYLSSYSSDKSPLLRVDIPKCYEPS